MNREDLYDAMVSIIYIYTHTKVAKVIYIVITSHDQYI